jgi:7,8-dihydropterin-6-yl-methyl-4-(beta-D-ribofuranosyl)aminobenzene 5'-phosphate synthase
MTTELNAAVELDELTITIVVDNATDTLSSIGPGIPQLPEIAYLLGASRPAVSTTVMTAPWSSTIFASPVTASRRSPQHDRGTARRQSCSTSAPTATSGWQTPSGWPSTCRASTCCPIALALDHTGGTTTVVAAIAAARDTAGRAPLIVDVHPDRPDQRGILTPFDNFAMLPPEPTIEAIEAAGSRVVAHAEAHEIGDLLLSSGDIPRQTSYETGLPGHHSWRGDQVTLDTGIHDERFLAANVRGGGTTVLSARSHAGVVNVGLEARRLLPDQPIDLLLGGYHLAGPAVEDRIEPTVRDLAELVAPRIVAPGHCTGWRAAAALANAFSPTAYAPSVVGTRYLLNAT